MRTMLQQLAQSLEAYMPNLLGALAILVIGWLAALVVAAVLRGVLRRTGIDARSPGQMPLSRSISKGVFYVLIVLVLGAFFQTLGLTMVVEPINGFLTQIFSFLPQLAGAGVLLLVAWIVGSLLRLVVRKALEAAKVDERLGQESNGEVQLTQSLSETVY